MSGLKKVFVIFTVAIVLATVTNVFLGGANATVENPNDSLTTPDTNTTENTNVENNATTENNVQENTVDNTNMENTTVADTNTNIADANTTTNTNAKNEFDWSQVRNTLPKTGSNYPLKNALIAVIFVATAILGFVCVYNKKVGMTDETKR